MSELKWMSRRATSKPKPAIGGFYACNITLNKVVVPALRLLSALEVID